MVRWNQRRFESGFLPEQIQKVKNAKASMLHLPMQGLPQRRCKTKWNLSFYNRANILAPYNTTAHRQISYTDHIGTTAPNRLGADQGSLALWARSFLRWFAALRFIAGRRATAHLRGDRSVWGIVDLCAITPRYRCQNQYKGQYYCQDSFHNYTSQDIQIKIHFLYALLCTHVLSFAARSILRFIISSFAANDNIWGVSCRVITISE